MLASRISSHAGAGPGVILDVLEDKGVAASTEPVQPVLDVGGVTGLGPFAVIDYINPSPHLALNCRLDSSRNTGGQGRQIDGNPVFTGKHDLNQIIRAGQ